MGSWARLKGLTAEGALVRGLGDDRSMALGGPWRTEALAAGGFEGEVSSGCDGLAIFLGGFITVIPGPLEDFVENVFDAPALFCLDSVELATVAVLGRRAGSSSCIALSGSGASGSGSLSSSVSA
jgi:hypothetical protein